MFLPARCRAHGYMGPAVLITLGVLFLLAQVSSTYWLNFDRTWPEGVTRTRDVVTLAEERGG